MAANLKVVRLILAGWRFDSYPVPIADAFPQCRFGPTSESTTNREFWRCPLGSRPEPAADIAKHNSNTGAPKREAIRLNEPRNGVV